MSKRIFKVIINLLLLVLLFQILLYCDNGKKKLVTFDGGEVTQDEYIELYLASTERKPDNRPDEKNLKKIVTRISMKEIPILEAKAQNVQNDSVYIKGFKKRKFSFLYTPYIDKKVVSTVIKDSLIQMFYKHYSPQYKLLYIHCPYLQDNKEAQKDTIENSYKILQTGIPFEKIADNIIAQKPQQGCNFQKQQKAPAK